MKSRLASFVTGYLVAALSWLRTSGSLFKLFVT